MGNRLGKQRASRSGAARRVNRWRCVVLSSGERTVETSIHAGGGKATSGQIVRLMDVPIARTFGAWDTLHDLPDGAALSNAIKQAEKTHYGHPDRVFLKRLTPGNRNWRTLLEQVKDLFDPGDEGQIKRVAERFALYGIAGELATEYGLTDWSIGDALKAAGEGFQLWLSERRPGNDEKRQIPEQVSDFIDRHGDAWFSDANIPPADRGPIIRNRAGWWKDADDDRTYLSNPQGLREALTGFDFKRRLDVLQAAGVLLSSSKPGSA